MVKKWKTDISIVSMSVDLNLKNVHYAKPLSLLKLVEYRILIISMRHLRNCRANVHEEEIMVHRTRMLLLWLYHLEQS